MVVTMKSRFSSIDFDVDEKVGVGKMDVYDAIEAVTKGQKVKTERMDSCAYWFMRDNIIYHRGPGDTEENAPVARIGCFMDYSFELVPKSTLSDLVFSIPRSRAAAEVDMEVIDVEDLVPKMKELKDYLHSIAGDQVKPIKVIQELNEILGPELVGKI